MEPSSSVNMTKSLEQRIAKEYRRSILTDWDMTFVIILAAALLLESLLVINLARRPIAEYSEKEIARIQERFANFVLEEEPRVAAETDLAASDLGAAEGEETEEGVDAGEEAGEGEEVGTETGEDAGTGAEERRAMRAASAETRRQTRQAISEEVSSKGILGLLTGSGSAASGNAVSGIFSGDGDSGGGDLDQVLASVGGLKSQGTPSGSGDLGASGARGGRSGSKATIDDLVSERESASTESLSRKGDLSVESPSDVEGRGRRSIFRSAEAIQEVLIKHNQAIQYCYERELKRNPTLKGKVVVRITVNADGVVTQAEIVSSTLNNERVERCILARIRLWKDFHAIDASEGDVTFRQGYLFGY